MARGTHAVALAVPDEAALLDVAARLERRGIPFVLVREPDPPWHGAAMAIGLPVVPEAPSGVLGRPSAAPIGRRSFERASQAAPFPAPPPLPDRRAVRRVLGGLPLLT